jgi:hypothetical protein
MISILITVTMSFFSFPQDFDVDQCRDDCRSGAPECVGFGPLFHSSFTPLLTMAEVVEQGEGAQEIICGDRMASVAASVIESVGEPCIFKGLAGPEFSFRDVLRANFQGFEDYTLVRFVSEAEIQFYFDVWQTEGPITHIAVFDTFILFQHGHDNPKYPTCNFIRRTR